MQPITAIIDNMPAMSAMHPFAPNPITQETRGDTPFSAFFNAAIGVMNDTNEMVAVAEQAQLDFATGRIDDIIVVQTALDRAQNAVTFTSQVTNRIIESYREIMRMTI